MYLTNKGSKLNDFFSISFKKRYFKTKIIHELDLTYQKFKSIRFWIEVARKKITIDIYKRSRRINLFFSDLKIIICSQANLMQFSIDSQKKGWNVSQYFFCISTYLFVYLFVVYFNLYPLSLIGCLSFYLLVYFSICLSVSFSSCLSFSVSWSLCTSLFMSLSLCLSVTLYVYPYGCSFFCPLIYLSLFLPGYLSHCPSVHIFLSLSFCHKVSLPSCLSVFLSLSMSALVSPRFSVHQSICISLFMSLCLFVSFSPCLFLLQTVSLSFFLLSILRPSRLCVVFLFSLFLLFCENLLIFWIFVSFSIYKQFYVPK